MTVIAVERGAEGMHHVQFRVDDAHEIRAHFARAHRVQCRTGVASQVSAQLRAIDEGAPWVMLSGNVGAEGWLTHDVLANQITFDQTLQIIGIGHVVGCDAGQLRRLGAAQRDAAA